MQAVVDETIAMATAPLMAVDEIQGQALSWPMRAQAFEVADARAYALGWEYLKGIKGLRAEAEKTFRPIIEKAYAAHKEACAQLKKIDQPLEQAERAIKGKLAAYEEEQERLRLAEQARLQAEEDARRAEQERLLLAQAARLQAEEQARIDAEIEAQIEQAEAQGATPAEIASMIERAPVAQVPVVELPPPAPPVQVLPAVARPTGGTVAKRWDCEVVDKQALIAACAKDPRFSNLIEVNLVAARQLAQALGPMFSVPGLRAYQKQVVGVRS
jgi:hypothetical protein